MHRFVLACACSVAVVAAACSGGSSSKPAADTTATAAAPPAPPPPPALTYADLAGKWTLTVTNQAGKTLLTEVMNATAGDTGWTAIRGKMKPVTLHPSLSGDSLMTDAGPIPSAIHKGATVTSHTVWHLQNGKLIGTQVAHYSLKTADSVETHHLEGTKGP